MKNDKDYMKIAFTEAQKAFDKGEVPIGAVVVCDGEIIGTGHNLREKTQDPTTHAEIIAIKEAAKNIGSWRLSKCEIYVTLEPCPMCLGAMLQSRIKRLVYAVEDKKGGAAGSVCDLTNEKQFNHQIEVKRGLMAEKSRQMLRRFFVNLREKNKKH